MVERLPFHFVQINLNPAGGKIDKPKLSFTSLKNAESSPNNSTDLKKNYSINPILSLQHNVMTNFSFQISLLTFKTAEKAQAAVDTNFGDRTTQQGTKWMWKTDTLQDDFFRKLSK